MMEDYMRGPVCITYLTRHQPEPFLFVFRLQSYLIPFNHHLGIRLPKLNISPSSEYWQIIYWRQVNWRLMLTIPTPALPIRTQIVVVPVLVAPWGWHGQYPLRLNDVELADHAVEW